MNGLGKQGFARASLTEQHNWDVWDLAASAANWRQRAMASLLVVRFSSLNLDGRACISGYRFMLWKIRRIGSNAYPISVRLPTMMCASPFIPTRRGRAVQRMTKEALLWANSDSVSSESRRVNCALIEILFRFRVAGPKVVIQTTLRH